MPRMASTLGAPSTPSSHGPGTDGAHVPPPHVEFDTGCPACCKVAQGSVRASGGDQHRAVGAFPLPGGRRRHRLATGRVSPAHLRTRPADT
ncbi:hypothetical protein DXG01_010647, partial [Tephrocybe rancida]